MPEKENGVPWYEQAGIPQDNIREQLPLLQVYRGEVAVNKTGTGNLSLVGSDTRGGQVDIIYRYNHQNQAAELVYINPGVKTARGTKDALADTITFNKSMDRQEAFGQLAEVMGLTPVEAAAKFPEAVDYDKIYFNLLVHEAKISINFTMSGKPQGLSYIYDYHLPADTVELVYTNDGKGKVWARWTDNSPTENDA